MRFLKQLRSIAAFAGAAVLASAAMDTFAVTTDPTASVSLVSGRPQLRIDLPSDFTMTHLDLSILYDPNKLTLDLGSLPGGSSISVGATLMDNAGFISLFDATGVAPFVPGAVPYALSGALLVPIAGETSIVFNAAFALKPGITSASVTFSTTVMNLDTAAIHTFDTLPDVVITAVIPEPENWALLLAGLGIIGATVRRRAAKA
jgi:hypothetical protein